ncbi:MAG: hypothetical protein KME33_25685, partial [Aetokthonos hydrillicola CCALA 1050]|nr:hypothetical protein [Aetokthonos hydrillicola CCALA 1050]
PGNLMVPMHQKRMRSLHEIMSITASVAAILWFQSRQYYGLTDKEFQTTHGGKMRLGYFYPIYICIGLHTFVSINTKVKYSVDA